MSNHREKDYEKHHENHHRGHHRGHHKDYYDHGKDYKHSCHGHHENACSSHRHSICSFIAIALVVNVLTSIFLLVNYKHNT